MQDAFGTVVWVVCIAGVVIALITLLLNRGTWEEFGKGGLVMERDATVPSAPQTPAALAERDDEIRQMLEARNARRARRGEPLLDVESELRRLTAVADPAFDDELLAEIRDLVHARNARRARTGKPPLDVEAEIAREIAALQELGTDPGQPPPPPAG